MARFLPMDHELIAALGLLLAWYALALAASQAGIHRTLCKKLSQTCTKLSSSSRPMGTEILPTILLPT